MDPYLMIEYGGLKFRTKTAKGAGKEPNWNEVLYN